MLTLTRCTVYFLVLVSLIFLLQTVFAEQHYSREDGALNIHLDQQVYNKVRQKRAFKKPGFLWILGSSIFQQFNETKSAYSQIRNLINDQFVDERRSAQNIPTPSTTPSPDASTTTEQYRITRSEFNRILMRNLRGLVRLYNLELQDALKQSEQNQADFNRQLKVNIKKELS